ncbi:hypothetical protein C9374_009034 [Naegleria lovaniensis]|uniref:Uncharacterized protein n=1 Tax=Naegleria lovaniensis TaxID=51637 RepID=A0AA88KH69_NAELO|nr:uncharacterized protein C9374_009034 [Naegleria lovaniensis]KAG2377518.1 hypothetical protein C9374_009034 [Naegleria lovaniensis]
MIQQQQPQDSLSQNEHPSLVLMKQCQLGVEDIIEEFDHLLENDRILNVYIYGSRLYGKTPTKNSHHAGKSKRANSSKNKSNEPSDFISSVESSPNEIQPYYTITPDTDFDIMMIYDYEEDKTPSKLTFLSNQKENKNSEFFQLLLPKYKQQYGHLPFTEMMKKDHTIYYKFTQKRFGLDMCLYSKEQFMNQVKKHQFSELIGLFLEKSSEDYQQFILRRKFNVLEEFTKQQGTINLSVLRSSLSQSASMCWKCCKSMYEHRLELDPPEIEIFKAKKTVIHTLRVYHYGVQIAQNNGITDWHACDKYYDDLLGTKDKYQTWREMSKVYGPIRLQLHEQFRACCPKEDEETNSNQDDAIV